MEQATFGIIGAGGIAQSQHLPNLTRAPHVRLKTICDLREDTLEEMRAKYSIPEATTDHAEMLADPEIQAVVVATKEDAQAPLTIEALRAGKHVYVEKPLAETPEACEAVTRAQAESGRFVAVGFNRRFAPAYVKARELAWRDGGPTNMYYRISDTYCRGWGRSCPPGIRVIHEVCHVFDILRWFADSDVKTIYAVHSRADDEIFTLQFESGCVATILNSGYGTRDLPKERIEIIAEQTCLIVEEFVELRAFGYPDPHTVLRYEGHSHPDYEYTHKPLLGKIGAEALYALRRAAWELGQENESDLRPDQDERRRFLASGQMWNYMVDKGWLAAVDHFAQCVLSGDTPLNATAQDGLKASILSHAAIRSRESGKALDVGAC